MLELKDLKIILIFIFFTYSCKSKELLLEKKTEKCIKKEFKKSIYNIEHISDKKFKVLEYFKMTKNINKTLIRGGYILKNDKKSYQNLLLNLTRDGTNEFAKSSIYLEFEKNGYNFISVYSNLFGNCSYLYLETKDKSILKRLRRIISLFEEKSFLDKELIKAFIEVIPSKKLNDELYIGYIYFLADIIIINKLS